MNIDELGEKHIIHEDFHGEFDENKFYDLVTDNILDHDIDQNNPNMEGGRHGAGQQGNQRMVVVDPMRNFPKFSGEKTVSADNQLGAFDDYLQVLQNKCCYCQCSTNHNQIWVFLICQSQQVV